MDFFIAWYLLKKKVKPIYKEKMVDTKSKRRDTVLGTKNVRRKVFCRQQ